MFTLREFEPLYGRIMPGRNASWLSFTKLISIAQCLKEDFCLHKSVEKTFFRPSAQYLNVTGRSAFGVTARQRPSGLLSLCCAIKGLLSGNVLQKLQY